MTKKFFRLRHAALASALALAMGAPLAFADEISEPGVVTLPTNDAPPPIVLDPAPLAESDAVLEPLPAGNDGIATEVTTEGPAPVDDGGVVIVEPPPADGDTGGVVDDPMPGDDGVAETPPVDDCGMICWNMAGEPGTEVYKGEEAPGTVVEFHTVGDNFRGDQGADVSAELSGAIGVAEQLGAAENAVDADTGVAANPLADQPATMEVASAAAGKSGNLIRDGHLR